MMKSYRIAEALLFMPTVLVAHGSASSAAPIGEAVTIQSSTLNKTQQINVYALFLRAVRHRFASAPRGRQK